MSETHATFQSLLLQEQHAYKRTCGLASISLTLLPAANTVKQPQVLLISCHHALCGKISMLIPDSNQALAGAAAGAAGATPALAPALGGVPGLLPAPVTANFCFFSAGFSICTITYTAV